MNDYTSLPSWSLDSSIRQVRSFADLASESSGGQTPVGLLLDPPYQRTSVWGPEQRQNLIRSFLMGLPIPAVVLNDRFAAGDGAFWSGTRDWRVAVVDGRQRLETLLDWWSGKLAVPAAWFSQDRLRHPAVELATRRRPHRCHPARYGLPDDDSGRGCEAAVAA